MEEVMMNYSVSCYIEEADRYTVGKRKHLMKFF